MANLGELVKRLGEGDQESRMGAIAELFGAANTEEKLRHAFQEVGLVDAVLKFTVEDQGIGKVYGCQFLGNLAVPKENQREIYQHRGLVVSSGVEGSSTIAQDS
jgi:hypothetical protein